MKKILTWLFVILISLEALIGLADVFLNVRQWLPSQALRRSFNITREDSIVNWFSSTQTFIIGLVLVGIAMLAYKYSSKKLESYGWGVLAVFFMFLSLDDGSKLHERIGTSFNTILENTNFPTYNWQLVLGPFFIAMGIFMVIFLWKNLKEKKALIAIYLALVLLAVAVGLDALEGINDATYYNAFVAHNLKLAEELIEMLAMSILLVTFLYLLMTRKAKLYFDLMI